MIERIVFTKHAKAMMIKRSLSKESVINVLESPSRRYLDTRSGYLIAIKRQGNMAIVVVYDLVEEHIEIVTAFKISIDLRLIRSRVSRGYRVEIDENTIR